jgi:NitT/TauT family transport system permease protein
MIGLSVPARTGGDRLSPRLIGFATLVAALLAAELLIQIGLINRFIVPPPSEVGVALFRIVTEEHVFYRFLVTAGECLVAGVMLTLVGVSTGVLMHRIKLLQRATETWVASMAAAPLVIMYPLFMVIFGRNALTIIMMGFIAGLPPAILKTIEGIAATRKVLVNVGRSIKLTPAQQFWKILFPAA